MRIQEIIATKRDGGTLSDTEIREFVEGYTCGDIPDYQVSALLMAIYLRGMDDRETATLTAAMAQSGEQIDLSVLPSDRPTIDKHSTGGVGDKTSLVVVPILAAAGASVCKMSGRGLGHTGGTLDKLESIPGFRVGLSPQEMVTQVATIGACLAGQTEQIAPADKKLYALRDATATVGSLPLIVSSILSKKLAGGAKHFLFDVKVGNGALLKTPEEARQLAQALVNGAKANGRKAVAVLTDMNQPLGRMIGNASEVREALKTLTPAEAPDARFWEVCITLANAGLKMVGLAENAEELVQSGQALRKLLEVIAAQGGIPLGPYGVDLPVAPVNHAVQAMQSGYVTAIGTAELGKVVVALGGGRIRKEDTIDPSVGLVNNALIGSKVKAGDVLAVVQSRTETDALQVEERIRSAYIISPESLSAPPLIHEVIHSD